MVKIIVQATPKDFPGDSLSNPRFLIELERSLRRRLELRDEPLDVVEIQVLQTQPPIDPLLTSLIQSIPVSGTEDDHIREK